MLSIFEELPNEIFFLIYSYLELTDLHRAFSSLNFRFEQLLINSFTSVHACLPCNYHFPLEKYSHQIRSLCLTNWHPTDLLEFLRKTHLPTLNYLKIQSSDHCYFGDPTNDLLRQIYSFDELRKCQLTLSPTIYIGIFDIPKCESIEHLNLSMITLDMLFYLLTRTPHLRTLNIWLNSNGRRLNSSTYPNYQCNKLKIFVVNLHNDIKFHEVTFLLSRMPFLRAFRITGTVWDERFLSDEIWQNILMGNNSFAMLDKINVNLLVRFAIESQNHMESLVNRFKRDLFERVQFLVNFQYQLWVEIKCSWNQKTERIS